VSSAHGVRGASGVSIRSAQVFGSLQRKAFYLR